MKKTTKWVGIALSSAMAATLVVGCGTANQSQGGNAQGAKKLTVDMVTDVGGIHDNSFNQGAWEGLTRAKTDLGLNANYAESKSSADYYPNLTGFVKSGSNLTWAIGYLMADDITKVAKENPNAKLAIVDTDLNGQIPSNVECVTFKENEGAFLMGVLAAKMSKSNKIGFVGGMQVPLIQKFEYGFKAGVKAVNPKATVTSVYAGAYDQPDKGKLLASQLYQNGADVIFHAAGATGDGVFAEAKELGAGHWVIGVDRDEYALAPNNTLSSEVKRVDTAVYNISKDLQNGKFDGGQVVTFGLKEDGVGYSPTTSKNTPADVIKLMDDYKQKIINNQITVPATEAEFNNFKL